jgi:hypothetical protein
MFLPSSPLLIHKIFICVYRNPKPAALINMLIGSGIPDFFLECFRTNISKHIYNDNFWTNNISVPLLLTVKPKRMEYDIWISVRLADINSFRQTEVKNIMFET